MRIKCSKIVVLCTTSCYAQIKGAIIDGCNYDDGDGNMLFSIASMLLRHVRTMQEQQDTAEVQRGETIRAFGHISSCWVELHCSHRPCMHPHLTRNVLTCHRVSGRQEIFSTQQGFARNLGPAKAPILGTHRRTPARTSALPNFDGGRGRGSSLEACRCLGGKLQLRRHSRCAYLLISQF